jgi:hypothetical protein
VRVLKVSNFAIIKKNRFRNTRNYRRGRNCGKMLNNMLGCRILEHTQDAAGIYHKFGPEIRIASTTQSALSSFATSLPLLLPRVSAYPLVSLLFLREHSRHSKRAQDCQGSKIREEEIIPYPFSAARPLISLNPAGKRMPRGESPTSTSNPFQLRN